MGFVCLSAFPRLDADGSVRLPSKEQDTVSTQRQSGRDSKQTSGNDAAAAARLTRGKKLVLKDGNFQLVREYERRGERVRYFSLERASWEEIPAAMVDWEATAKAQADSEKASE